MFENLKNNMKKLLRLLTVCIITFIFSISLSAHTNTGISNDPDGYTNIRKEPNTKSEIIGRVIENEKFEYTPDNTNWWQVTTKDGIKGYIHKSRIKDVDGKITPHDPSNVKDNKFWNDLIEKVVQNKDYNTLTKIFELSKQTDGVYSTQFTLDIFEIYKKDPSFFIKSVKKYYNSNYSYILSWWINEVGDFTIEDIKEYSRNIINDPDVKDFINQAEIANKKLLDMLRNNKNKKNSTKF